MAILNKFAYMPGNGGGSDDKTDHEDDQGQDQEHKQPQG